MPELLGWYLRVVLVGRAPDGDPDPVTGVQAECSVDMPVRADACKEMLCHALGRPRPAVSRPADDDDVQRLTAELVTAIGSQSPS